MSLLRAGAGRPIDAVAAGGASPAWTATANPAIVNNGFGSSTTTFTDQAIGTASADRIVVVFVSSTFHPTSSVTCGGNAMTLAAQSDNVSDTPDASLWYLNVTTGTTATIVVEGGIQFVGITVGILTGVTATPTTTAIKPQGGTGDPQVTTSALTVPATGFGLVVMGTAATSGPYTWNVGTRDFSTSSASMTIESGFISASGSQTPSVSGPGFAATYMAAATWGP